jgi:hypothetical protein
MPLLLAAKSMAISLVQKKKKKKKGRYPIMWIIRMDKGMIFEEFADRAEI